MCNEYLDVVLPVSLAGWIDEVMSIQWWVLDVGQQQSLSTCAEDNQITPQTAFAVIQRQILLLRLFGGKFFFPFWCN